MTPDPQDLAPCGACPTTPMTVRVQLPANFIVCDCGGHYLARGQRVRTEYCREDRWI